MHVVGRRCAALEAAKTRENCLKMNVLNWFATVAQTTEKAPPAGPLGGLGSMLPLFALMFIAFYFLILRPQKRDQQKRQSLLDSMGKGDRVITVGGIHGVIEGVDKEKGTVTLTVAPKTSMKFNKASISSIESKKGEKQEK